METTELEKYILCVKETWKTDEEIGRLLQDLERKKFEYEEAKLVVAAYERLPVEKMIEACDRILKEKNHDRETRRS